MPNASNIEDVVNPYSRAECPDCHEIGRVGKNHIGGGAENGNDECYCYACSATFNDPIFHKSEPTNEEILEWTSDENLRHMHEHEEIIYQLEWYFKSYEATPSGKTAAMVARMTTYQKIGVLSEMVAQEHDEKLPPGLYAEMHELVHRINAEGFMTADDYYRGSVCVMCKCGQDFTVTNRTDALPSHALENGFPCNGSGCVGVAQIAPHHEM